MKKFFFYFYPTIFNSVPAQTMSNDPTTTNPVSVIMRIRAKYAVRWNPMAGGPSTADEVIRTLGSPETDLDREEYDVIYLVYGLCTTRTACW